MEPIGLTNTRISTGYAQKPQSLILTDSIMPKSFPGTDTHQYSIFDWYYYSIPTGDKFFDIIVDMILMS